MFFVDDDRRVYLEFLADYSRRFGLDVLGWCLMSNHVHLVAVPTRKDSLAKVLGQTDSRYAQYVNRLHGRTGHLWQNRFYSCPLDEKHTIAALRYIEQNPARARVVRLPWRYPWSSAAAHVGEGDRWELLDLRAWRSRWRASDWRKMLRSPIRQPVTDAIRHHTSRGRPLGSDSFLSKVEHLLGRRVRPLPVGRPKGWRKRRRKRK